METVTYTLVAFVLIGLILAFVEPKIQELQDKALIEQSMNVLKQIDSVIKDVDTSGVGNKRMIEVSVKKGEIIIDSENDTISFVFEGKYMYSEPGQKMEDGLFEVLTTNKGSDYEVRMELNYSNFDLTYLGEEKTKVLQNSPSAYELFISNKGGENKVIDFSLK